MFASILPRRRLPWIRSGGATPRGIPECYLFKSVVPERGHETRVQVALEENIWRKETRDEEEDGVC